MNVDAVLGGNFRRVHGGDADDVLNFLLDLGGPRRRQVDLVDDGQDLQAVVNGQIGVRQRLGLDALRRVDDQHCALAGGQAAGDFIVEVDVTRRVDEVQDVFLAVVGAVVQQTVGQRGFAVVNVGDDRKIADMRKVGHVRFLS